jgi:hypothetical protein
MKVYGLGALAGLLGGGGSSGGLGGLAALLDSGGASSLLAGTGISANDLAQLGALVAKKYVAHPLGIRTLLMSSSGGISSTGSKSNDMASMPGMAGVHMTWLLVRKIGKSRSW